MTWNSPRVALVGLMSVGGLLALSATQAVAQDTSANSPVTSIRTNKLIEASKPKEAPLQIAQVPTLQAALAGATVTAPRAQLGPVGAVAGRVVPIAIRLGAMISPRTKFIGGADFTFTQLSPGMGLVPRLDAEAIVSANFGGITTLIPVTFNLVYSKGVVSGTRVYGGAGIGPYFGEVTRFGGKLFVGADFTNKLGGELGVHFAGFGDPIVTAQVRLGL